MEFVTPAFASWAVTAGKSPERSPPAPPSLSGAKSRPFLPRGVPGLGPTAVTDHHSPATTAYVFIGSSSLGLPSASGLSGSHRPPGPGATPAETAGRPGAAPGVMPGGVRLVGGPDQDLCVSVWDPEGG